jgi:hypothetical protein
MKHFKFSTLGLGLFLLIASCGKDAAIVYSASYPYIVAGNKITYRVTSAFPSPDSTYDFTYSSSSIANVVALNVSSTTGAYKSTYYQRPSGDTLFSSKLSAADAATTTKYEMIVNQPIGTTWVVASNGDTAKLIAKNISTSIASGTYTCDKLVSSGFTGNHDTTYYSNTIGNIKGVSALTLIEYKSKNF